MFALMSDLRRKARLNPNIQVIRVELLGGEPVREGSIFYHRFQRGTQILEYRSRCIRCVPPRLFHCRSQTEPPFEVQVTVEPIPGGCRIRQEEMLEVTPALMDALEPIPVPDTLRDALAWIGLFPSLRPLGIELRALQRERIVQRLSRELGSWLAAVRSHLETEGTPERQERRSA